MKFILLGLICFRSPSSVCVCISLTQNKNVLLPESLAPPAFRREKGKAPSMATKHLNVDIKFFSEIFLRIPFKAKSAHTGPYSEKVSEMQKEFPCI